MSLAPGASCALTLGFDPTATGPRTGTVQLFDNAPNSPQVINLSGTGTSTAGPTSLSVDTAGNSATQAFTITITPPPPLGAAGCAKIAGQPNAVSGSMSGPAIAGRVPSGQAVLDESRITTCGGYSVLNVSVSNVNLPDNTVLWIYLDSRLVGRVALANGQAKMPPFNLGDYLSRKDAVLVYDTPPPVTTLEPTVLSSGFLQ